MIPWGFELKRGVRGLFLVVLSIFLGSMFFVRSYHNFYWSHPASFIIITVVGAFSALYGSFLVGNSLHLRRIKRGMLSKFFAGTGALVAVAGGVLGVMAISIALAISGTGYWGSAPYEYSGDYLIMGLQIFVLRLSIPVEIVGGFILGYSLIRKGREI